MKIRYIRTASGPVAYRVVASMRDGVDVYLGDILERRSAIDEERCWAVYFSGMAGTARTLTGAKDMFEQEIIHRAARF
jgi:hypothetical protein